MAVRTISNTGGDYSATATWVEGVVPTAADDVVATATSGQLTVNVNSVCLSIDFTNYVSTLTMNATLTVGNATSTARVVRLVSAMTITTTVGTPILLINSAASMTSNGKTWPYQLQFTGIFTATLVDNWTVSETLTSLSGQRTLNSFTITIAGGLNSAGGFIGTTNLVMNGTGTWSGANGVSNNLTFNTAGTITISGAVAYSSGALTYTAGTIITTGSTLTLGGTVNTSGISWNNVTLLNGGTTLLSNLNVSGTFRSGNITSTINGAFNVNVGGNFTMDGIINGNTNGIILNGTGTWSSIANNGEVRVPLTFNTAGTITISGNVYFGLVGALTYIAGTMVTTGSTLNLLYSPNTINTSGMTWNNISSLTANSVFTLTSNLNLSGNLLINASTTFNGLFNINIGGNLTTLNSLSGTTSIIMNGTGTWSGGGVVSNNLTFNTAGTITVSGVVNYGTGTMTRTTGTFVTTSSTLQIVTSCTLNTNGISWNNVSSITGIATITNNSLLTILGVLTLGAFDSTFIGTTGFTAANLLINNTANSLRTYTLAAGNTYIISNSIKMVTIQTAADVFSVLTSNHATNTVTFNYTGTTANQTTVYFNATRINSSGGNNIKYWRGTMTGTTNWSEVSAGGAIGSVSM